MNRYLCFVLLLFCSACSLQNGTLYAVAPTAVPQNSPTGQQDAILATPVLQSKDATGAGNDAFLMGENGKIDYTATVGPNLQATIDIMVRRQIEVTENARADAMLIAKYTATQQALVNNFTFASQTAQAPASTATKAAQDAEATQQIAYITQSAFIVYATQNAPAQELDAAETRAQANTALFRAMAGPLSILVLLVFVTACLIYAIRNPHKAPVDDVEAEQSQPQERPFVERTVPAMGTSVRRETPPGWSHELMAAFAQAVRRADYPQGKPLTRDEWLGANGLLTRPQWIQLETYITETNPYAYAVNNTGSLGWTPAGEYWVALFDGEQVEPLPHTEENQDL